MLGRGRRRATPETIDMADSLYYVGFGFAAAALAAVTAMTIWCYSRPPHDRKPPPFADPDTWSTIF